MTQDELKSGVAQLTTRWCEQLPVFLAEMGPAYSERDPAKPCQDYYMRANTRIRWFQEYCTERSCLGRITSTLEAQPLVNGCVLIQAKAEVYMDGELVSSDVSGKLVSCAPGVERVLTRMDLEALSTFAKSRALANAGFTITGREPDDTAYTCDRGVAVYDSEVEDYKASVSAGAIPGANPVMDIIQASKQMFGTTQTNTQPLAPSAPSASNPVLARNEGNITIVPNECEVKRDERERQAKSQAAPVPSQSASITPPQPVQTTPTPPASSGTSVGMTVDEARAYVVPGNGRYGGKTFGEIAATNGISTLNWFAKNYSGKDEKVREAAKLLAAELEQKLSAS